MKNNLNQFKSLLHKLIKEELEGEEEKLTHHGIEIDEEEEEANLMTNHL
jgi:hypothetical protein